MNGSHPIPNRKCFICGYVQELSTCPTNDTAQPQPGDYSVCLNCGEVAQFDENLAQIPVEEDQQKAALIDSRELASVVRAIKARGLIHEVTE